MNWLTAILNPPKIDSSGNDRCHDCEAYGHSGSFETTSPDPNLQSGHPYHRAPMLTLEGSLCDGCASDDPSSASHNTA